MADNGRDFHINLSKRDFLKTAFASGVTLAAAGLIKLFKPSSENEVAVAQSTGSYFYGTDSGAAVRDLPDPNKWRQNFYIGKLGSGEATVVAPFNIPAAQDSGYYRTHMYWLLKGPSYYRRFVSNWSCYQYGLEQAKKACEAWKDKVHNTNSFYVGGKTIFADIEEPFEEWEHTWPDPENNGYCTLDDGWENPNPINIGENREVLKGWIDGIANYSDGAISGFVPGIYTRPQLWNSWFGEVYVTSRPFVLWLTGVDGQCQGCAPCNTSCSTAMIDAANRFSSINNIKMGGCKPVIWQYWLSPGCPTYSCGDYCIASQSGGNYEGTVRNFMPLTDIYIPMVRGNGQQIFLNAYPAPGTSLSTQNEPDSQDFTSSYPPPSNGQQDK